MAAVNVLIIALGVIGIAAALAVIVETAVTGVRARRYLDLVIVLLVAALAVWLLVRWGDILLR